MEKSTMVALGCGAGAAACAVLAVHFWRRQQTKGMVACGVIGGCAAVAAGSALYSARRKDTLRLEYRGTPQFARLGNVQQGARGRKAPDGCGGNSDRRPNSVMEESSAGAADSSRHSGGTRQGPQTVPVLKGTPEQFVATQKALVGTPYVWGGKNPAKNGGLDCSGAVLYGLNQLGNSIPERNADTIYHTLTFPVARDDLRPGDLRFMDDDNDGVIDHVQVIVGKDGTRVNATGTKANTRSNPGIIELLPGPLPQSGEVRRLNFREN